MLCPAGAAPAYRFGTQFDGNSQDDFLNVLVDGVPFVASMSSDGSEMWERSFHADYSTMQSYKALMYAGLLLSEMSEVYVLMTGLPVSQALVPERCKQLEAQFVVTHQITPKRSVNVKSVKVIPNQSEACWISRSSRKCTAVKIIWKSMTIRVCWLWTRDSYNWTG